MRFLIALPNDRSDAIEEFLVANAVATLAAEFESLGFHGCFVTDHPFPEDRWLAAGGHQAADPFVLLGIAATATTDLRLHTNIVVLPYRNPFLLARSALTVDVASNGRLVLGVGSGYVEGEFAALGAEFSERNRTVDEGIEAIKLAWTTDGVVFEGSRFRAGGNTMLPRPCAKPHPPIWMGGNSRVAIRKAVEHCDGWIPYFNQSAERNRTPRVSTLRELEDRIAYAHEHAALLGRSTPFEVCLGLLPPIADSGKYEPTETRDYIRALTDVGVTSLGIRPRGATRAEYLNGARQFADDIMRS